MPTELIGVVHLLPLPGAPRPSPGIAAVLSRALADARTLADGGADGLIVENFGDAPFDKGPVSPATVAAMALIAAEVHRVLPDGFPVGINVLRNDPLAAIGIAAAVGAAFVRINVHVGAMVTDQGVIEGDARATLLERNRLGEPIRIVADVLVKHAVPLGAWTLEDAARDTVHRGLADVVVVSGAGTGQATDPEDVRRVRLAIPGTPIWIGSGLVPPTVRTFPPFDGAIVGTWLHRDSRIDEPIDVDRVRQMRKALS